MMKQSGIYCLKNIVNGKVYIGSSQDLYMRNSRHFTALKSKTHHSKHLQSAYNIQGGGFVFGTIEYCSINDFEAREQHWIKYYDATDNNKGYNRRIECSSNRGYKQSDEVRQGMAKRMRERIVTDATRKKMSESCMGRKVSEAAKAKLRKENAPPERLEKMRNAKKGKPGNNRVFTESDIDIIKTSLLTSRQLGILYNVSKTTILNILKGKIYTTNKQTPIIKIRQWRSGWKHTEETKIQMSKSAKGVPKKRFKNAS